MSNKIDIGDRVLCTDDSVQPHTAQELKVDMPAWVKKGEKYTIRGFVENDGIVPGVYLEEVTNPVRFFKLLNRSQEGAFRIDRFRKLQEDEVEAEVEQFEEVY